MSNIKLVYCNEGDGIGIVSGNKFVSVNLHGRILKRKSNEDDRAIQSDIRRVPVNTAYELKSGGTYIVNGNIAKFIDRNLFYMCFIVFYSNGEMHIEDFEYDQAMSMCYSQEIMSITV